MNYRPIKRRLERIIDAANRGALLQPEGIKGDKQELATLARMRLEVKRFVSVKPNAKVWMYHGKLFRLRRFGGWVMVLTYRGWAPVLGPIRVSTQGELTGAMGGPHDPACLQTTGNGLGGPNNTGGRVRHPGGFFTSFACAASSMAGRMGEPQGSPVPVFRSANPVRARHPLLAEGSGIQTANTGAAAMRTTASGTRALAPTSPTTLIVPREDLDRITSAFSAMPFVIEHCDSTAAVHVANIFEQFCHDVFDEADASSAIGWGDAAIQQADANVRLIAAARELHQACAAAESLLTLQKFHATEHTEEGRTLLALRAALAKVEGGAV